MLQLVRVDDRLVHGQVVVGWGSALHFSRIVVCDDTLGIEEWEVELIRSACPPEIVIEFVNEAELMETVNDYIADDIKTIILVGKVCVLEHLSEMHFPFTDINLGGLHYRSGREKLLSYLYLDDDEKNILRSVMKKGYHLYAQDLPTNKKFEMEEIII